MTVSGRRAFCFLGEDLMPERQIRWVQLGPPWGWGIRSTEELVQGSTVVVKRGDGEETIVEVGTPQGEEGLTGWHRYSVARKVEEI